MPTPLVTVICLCYNQGRFVRDAIRSVIKQTYPSVELLIVDDASTDHSARIINDAARDLPAVRFFPLTENVGNCKAFNHALEHARGEYIIDLAADDMLMPERISEGVRAFSELDARYGVNFADAWLMDEEGKELYKHSDRYSHEEIPQGDVYAYIVERYFMLSPTMMFRRKVLTELGGYDETLAYEDFDIQVRSSRKYLYCYTPTALVKKRIVKNSMSQKQFRPFNPQLRSTCRICEKILALNRTPREQEALSRRILYEMRTCLRLFHFPLLIDYFRLWWRNRSMRY